MRSRHASRTGECSIAADAFMTACGVGALLFAAVEKGDAVGKLARISIARKEGSAVGVDLGDDVREVHGAVFAQHELIEACQGQSPRTPRVVLQSESH